MYLRAITELQQHDGPIKITGNAYDFKIEVTMIGRRGGIAPCWNVTIIEEEFNRHYFQTYNADDVIVLIKKFGGYE